MKSESRRRNASSENASARWNRSFDCKLRFTQNDLNRSFTRRVQLKKQTSIGTKFVTTPCKSNLNKENLAVLFANIKKRLSTAHEPLSPKQWPDRPTDDSFQQSLKKLHQNTLQCESGKLPKHMEHDDQSYFFYHMFCLERSRPLPRSFIDHQKDFSVDNRSKYFAQIYLK